MRVVYDLLGFQSRDHGERGIARYVLQLGLALERTHPGLVTDYLVHPDLPFPAGAEPLIATGRITRSDEQMSRRALPSEGGIFIAGSPFECFNQPSELVLPPFARSTDWRRVAVVHDLIPAIFPELYLTNQADTDYFKARLTALCHFDRFWANSQATADDTMAMLKIEPGHVEVIGAGADDRFRPPEDGPEVAAAELVRSGLVEGLRPGYILFPTGIDPRKNIERAIQAYGQLPELTRRQHQMVLACRVSDADREVVAAMAHEAGVGPELLITGYISDDLLCRLYQGAHLVIFPSYYEGFGLPALEAMNCGAPVICADATSLIEVQPVAEARFDPLSVDAITSAMANALADGDLRQRLRTQPPSTFTWDNAGRIAGDGLQELIEGMQSARPAGVAVKPRLALFSALPPQETGIAAYTYRLAAELQQLCDVTVFVDANPQDVTWPAGVQVERMDRFESITRSGGVFDQLLYFIGNSRFHIEALRLLELYPGTVLLHDVRLTELYRELHRLHPERLVDGSVGATLASEYPSRYRHEVEQMPTISQETADRFGILMAKQVADAAEQVLVHSQFAATLLTVDTGIEAVVPFEMPCPMVPSAGADPLQSRSPIIGSFGSVAPSKQPEKLIAALATVHRYAPGTRIRFVGSVEKHVEEQLLTIAARQGVAPYVDFVGAVDGEVFAKAQRRSSVAVQLRKFSNGESSAAVAELLSLGIPTVVSDLGSMGELPDDVVVKIGQNDSPAVLGEAIGQLLADPERRGAISEAAIEYSTKNSFTEAAERLVEVLFAGHDDVEGDRSTEAHLDLDLQEMLAPINERGVRAAIDLERIRNANSAYLGEHVVLTSLYTGHKLFVDSRDISVAPALIFDGCWEPETTDVFGKLLRAADTVIDIGANVGYYGIIASAVVDPRLGGSIHMIEANPSLVALIQKSIEASGLDGLAHVSNYAISDRNGTVELNVPQHLWGSSYLQEFDETFRQSIEAAQHGPLQLADVLTVPAVTLDEYVKQHRIDRVDLVKIDIEGHEEQAYAGMSGVIEQNRDHLRLLVEFSSRQYADPAAFFDRISDDFSIIHALQPGSSQPIEITSHDEILRLSESGFVMLVARNS
ncbi:MAG: FkbM family methyltransferase [Acidimicrobiales bacterium]